MGLEACSAEGESKGPVEESPHVSALPGASTSSATGALRVTQCLRISVVKYDSSMMGRDFNPEQRSDSYRTRIFWVKNVSNKMELKSREHKNTQASAESIQEKANAEDG